ncbi:MAG: DsbC family protein [Steroidobacteraceae bacterium]|jgi:thiol:disulfide interchange protein DsbC
MKPRHSPANLTRAAAIGALLVLVLIREIGAQAASGAMSPAPAPAATPAPPAAMNLLPPPANVSVSAAELAAVAARIAGAKVSELHATPVPGIYEYRQGTAIAYVTQDGRFAFTGDMYQLKDKANLTDTRRREVRRTLIGALPEASMIIYSPKDPKYTVTVFTDVDCQYCRALHRQIADYNGLGIRVRYISFPRTGPNTASWTKAEQVWCSADRRSALTQAKLGKPLTTAVCKSNPVAQHYALGLQLALPGTPGIITDSGDLLPGYLAPEDLLEALKADGAPTPKS